jgi:type 1 fimbria pilin
MKSLRLVAALAAALFVSATIASSHDSGKDKFKGDTQAAPVYEYVL